MMGFGGLEAFEKSRIDRQSGHIIHNPIFVRGLRFRLKFREILPVAIRGRRSRGTGTTGIGRGSGHRAALL
jgi:hypothetical protein